MVDTKKLISKKEYTHYRMNKSIPKIHRIKARDPYLKFIGEYYQALMDAIIEEDSGVMIKGIGYWFIWRIPRKLTWQLFDIKNGRKRVEMFNYATDHYRYMPVFLPTNNRFFWSMDKGFTTMFRQRLHKKLIGGMQYKMYPSTLKRMKLI